MAAYVISEIELLDAEQLGAYRALAAPAVAAFGGRYLARGGQVEVAEAQLGDSGVRQVVIIEFESLDNIHAWYHSPEYARALEIQPKASRRRLTFVDGVPPATT